MTEAPVRTRTAPAVGRSVERVDGPLKVTGTAPYAYEQPVDRPLYLHPVRASVPRGRITGIEAADALALHDSVRVITHENARRLAQDTNRELWVLQDDTVHFWGQFVALAVAGTPELARLAAAMVEVHVDAVPADTLFRPDHQDQYRPASIIGGSTEPDTVDGDFDAAWAEAAVRVDREYTTARHFHNSIEPGTTVAIWHEDDRVTVYDSNQGPTIAQHMLAALFGLPSDRVVVHSPYVGGGFGAKVVPRPHHVAALLAAHAAPGHAVKFALTRQHSFTGTTHRTPTWQRVRLGANADGRLLAVGHDTVEETARYKEHAEQVGAATRVMYAARSRVTTHRLVPLDISTPGFMRAPGEMQGLFALESAMDELAADLGLDPIELRLRNEPETDPETGQPWSSRDVRWCLREGAARFGWGDRDPAPRKRMVDGCWVGTGVALGTFPRVWFPGTAARVTALAGGRYRVEIGAVDIGTGAWTILRQVAADALEVDLAEVSMEIGSSAMPSGAVAGGSAGTGMWSDAVAAACHAFRDQFGVAPSEDAQVTGNAGPAVESPYSRHAWCAQFAEVRVDADTGEVRVTRLLGAFDVGRVINPRTAWSQLVGGMTMALSAALFEDGVIDPRFGHVITQDLATYHVAAHADVLEVDAFWLGTPDPHFNRLGTKGLGEVGATGVAGAIANAAWHATGIRVRSLPMTPEHFLSW